MTRESDSEKTDGQYQLDEQRRTLLKLAAIGIPASSALASAGVASGQSDVQVTKKDFTGDGSDDIRIENSEVFLQFNSEDISTRHLVSTAGRQGGSNLFRGGFETRPSLRHSSHQHRPEFQSLRSFEILEDGGSVGAFRISREYTYHDERIEITADVTLFTDDNFFLIELTYENIGSGSLTLDQDPGNIHDGIMIFNGLGLAGRSDGDDEYRFHLAGQSTRKFANTYKWQTFSATNRGTFFDSQDALTYGLLNGATEPKMWIEEPGHLDFLVQETTLDPGQSITYSNVFGLHSGGSDAPDTGAQIYDDAKGRASKEPNLELENVRIVQTVENTRIGNDKETVADLNYEDSYPDPPLVREKLGTVVFDLTGQNFSELTNTVTIEVKNEGEKVDQVTLSPEFVRNRVKDTESSLFDFIDLLSPFTVRKGQSVTVKLSGKDIDTVRRTLSIEDSVEMPELNVGVMAVERKQANLTIDDGDYGNEVERLAKAIQQFFPATRVNVFRRTDKSITAVPDIDIIDYGVEELAKEDLKNVRQALDDVLPVSSNSTTGEIITVKRGNNIETETTLDSFDVTLGVFSETYFNDFRNLNVHGLHPNYVSKEAVDELQPPAAAGTEINKPISTPIMELGHHFLGPTYPEEVKEDMGFHISADVYSTIYRLNPFHPVAPYAQGGNQSFMNSIGTQPDSLTHQYLINSNFDPVPEEGTSYEAAYISISGTISDAGEVIITKAEKAIGGFVSDLDTGDVTATVTSATDDNLTSISFPGTLMFTHEGEDNRSFRSLLANVPYPEDAYEITFEVEDSETDDVTTTIVQPAAEALFSAIEWIPKSGFTRRPDERRKALDNKIAAIEEKMEAKEFHEAKQKLDNDFRRMTKRWLKDEYEAAANEFTKQEMLDLVNDMVARLETLVQSSS